MSPSSTIVLITGTTRGIGLGLLKSYLAKPNHTVIAANRQDPDSPASKALLHDELLPLAAEGTSLILVKIDATVRTDPAAAMETLAKVHGVRHIDIVIANAAIATSWPTVRDLDTDIMQQHIEPNVYGYVWLYQAVVGLLEKSKSDKGPLLMYIGSNGAWLTVCLFFYVSCLLSSLSPSPLLYHTGNMNPYQNSCYAPTKLVGHFLTKSIHQQEPWLTAFPIHPGWVRTDMGREGARQVGADLSIPSGVSVDESVRGMVAVADSATRETHGGRMFTWEGEEVPY